VSGESQRVIFTIQKPRGCPSLGVVSEPMVARAKTTRAFPWQQLPSLHLSSLESRSVLKSHHIKTSTRTAFYRGCMTRTSSDGDNPCGVVLSPFESLYLTLYSPYHAAFSAAPAPWATQQGCRRSPPLPLSHREPWRSQVSNIAVTLLWLLARSVVPRNVK
jgi:hypothetical protein